MVLISLFGEFPHYSRCVFLVGAMLLGGKGIVKGIITQFWYKDWLRPYQISKKNRQKFEFARLLEISMSTTRQNTFNLTRLLKTSYPHLPVPYIFGTKLPVANILGN